MANMTFGVNIIPKSNTSVTLGNSDNPWTIVSPELTGTPTAPTAASGTNTDQVATTSFVTTAVSGKADASDVIPVSEKGTANGVAELDSAGKVPSAQLPGYVDDVLEYDSMSEFPEEGESGKIYIAKDTNITYRWGGTVYVPIGSDLALGETETTAYRGDRGKAAYDHATESGRLTTAQASGLYKVAVTGEGHVASVTAVEKADITTLGIPGDIPIDDTAGDGDTDKVWSADKVYDELDLKAPKDSPVFTTSVSMGRKANTTVGANSVALGSNVTSSSSYSFAEGSGTVASNTAAHAEGTGTTANAIYSHAEGQSSKAGGQASHAEGYGTYASNSQAHAEGYYSRAFGTYSHAEGQYTYALGIGAHAEGIGYSSSSTGYGAQGKSDHSEGYRTLANSGSNSNNYGAHAEGKSTTASNNAAHAEGGSTTASGAYSHAEGYNTQATMHTAHAEGEGSKAQAQYAHAEGYYSKATSNYAHAEGNNTTASAYSSHAEGYYTEASGLYSHVEGNYTKALGPYQHVSGQYNVGIETGSVIFPPADEVDEFDSTKDFYTSGSLVKVNGTVYVAHNNANVKRSQPKYDTINWHTVTLPSGTTPSEWSTTSTYALNSYVKVTNANGVASYYQNHNAITTSVIIPGAGNDGSVNWHTQGEGSEYTGFPLAFEIVGNGAAYTEGRNIRVLDASGDEHIAGDMYVHCANDGSGGEKLASTNNPVFTGSISMGRKAGTTVGANSVATGSTVTASGYCCHAEGNLTSALDTMSHAEGDKSVANNYASHAEGNSTTAMANFSHAEGQESKTTGAGSHSEGYKTIANGYVSHAEGYGGSYALNGTTYTSIADGVADHTEGYMNLTANNMPGNHAEGHCTRATGGGAHSEGQYTLASGSVSHAEGYGNTFTAFGDNYTSQASGMYSHSEGESTAALNRGAHSEGINTLALGKYSHAEGSGTKASGDYSHSEGAGTQATNNYCHAEGGGTIASGSNSHSEGSGSQATGSYSHAEGSGTTAVGSASHAEGVATKANGNISHAEGESTIADGNDSHAEGYATRAWGNYSHAEGYSSTSNTYTHPDSGQTYLYGANGLGSHAEGYFTIANGTYSHAEGDSSKIFAGAGHAEGYLTRVDGYAGHSEGYNTKATQTAAHAEGYFTIAYGQYSHAEGMGGLFILDGTTYTSQASGSISHAEGEQTIAGGTSSHSEGKYTMANGVQSHAEGLGTKAEGSQSHAEGSYTTASDNSAHSEGYSTTASGGSSHAEGSYTIANHYAQHAGGAYNVEDPSIAEAYARGNYIEIIGNGVSGTRSNARALDWNGNERLMGDVYVGCNADSTGGNKVVALDSNGKVPSSVLPSYVDDVEEYDAKDFTDWAEWVSGTSYIVGDEVKVTDTDVTGYICTTANSSATFDPTEWDEATSFPATGESGKIYIALDTNKTYRWGGSTYVAIGSSLALGETSSTAYRGDRGAAAYAAAVTNVDSSPASASTNLVTSGGVYTALDDKAPKANPVFTGSISLGRKANTTVGNKSVALGNSVEASGQTSFAEGNFTTASGSCSHAEGQQTTASGIDAHAEGSSTTASGEHSHAENFSSNAYGKGSHAEGYATAADGSYCHVSGIYNARDLYSNYPTWTANHSYAVGDKVKRTVDNAYRLFVCIEANSDATFTDAHWQDTDGVLTYAEIIGNGTANNARSNARALDWDGNEYLKGDVYVGCNADSTGGTKLATVSQIPSTMTGATASTAGTSGLVPAPAAGDENKVLKGDGTWAEVGGGSGLPDAPTTDGTYYLQCVVSSGTPTFSWVTIPSATGVSF